MKQQIITRKAVPFEPNPPARANLLSLPPHPIRSILLIGAGDVVINRYLPAWLALQGQRTFVAPNTQTSRAA